MKPPVNNCADHRGAPMRPLGDDWFRCTPRTLTEDGKRAVRCKHTAKPERPKRKGKR